MKTRFILIAGALAASLALAEPQRLVDPALFEKAPVVLRVRWINDSEADKYAWQNVDVLEVLKNDSKQTFTNAIMIAHYSWTNGIPRAKCTAYLERYNPQRDDLWKLMGGSAQLGVSHIEMKASANNGPSLQSTRDVKQSENGHKAGSLAAQP